MFSLMLLCLFVCCCKTSMSFSGDSNRKVLHTWCAEESLEVLTALLRFCVVFWKGGDWLKVGEAGLLVTTEQHRSASFLFLWFISDVNHFIPVDFMSPLLLAMNGLLCSACKPRFTLLRFLLVVMWAHLLSHWQVTLHLQPCQSKDNA